MQQQPNVPGEPQPDMPQPSQPGQPGPVPPETPTRTPDIDVPSPGTQPTRPSSHSSTREPPPGVSTGASSAVDVRR